MSPESCQHIILDRHLCTEGAGGLTGTCNCNLLLTGLRWSLRKFSLINKLWRVGFNENNSTIEHFNKIHKLTSYPPGPRLKLNTLNYFRCKFQVTLCTFLTILTLAGRLRELTRVRCFHLNLKMDVATLPTRLWCAKKQLEYLFYRDNMRKDEKNKNCLEIGKRSESWKPLSYISTYTYRVGPVLTPSGQYIAIVHFKRVQNCRGRVSCYW